MMKLLIARWLSWSDKCTLWILILWRFWLPAIPPSTWHHWLAVSYMYHWNVKDCYRKV